MRRGRGYLVGLIFLCFQTLELFRGVEEVEGASGNETHYMSLRDLAKRDKKLQRWLKLALPDPFQPNYFVFPPSRKWEPLSSSQKKRRRRSGTPPEPNPVEDRLKQLSKNISIILDSLLKNYDRKVRPDYGRNPVEVGVTMYVLSISSMSEVLMDFTLDFYFRQIWKDPRLSFDEVGGVTSLAVSSEYLKDIWVPDTFFVNEKTSYFHTATTSNEFLRITKDGEVLRSIRLTVTATCNMDLHHFPMDSQLCNVEIESYGYDMADIRYKWARGNTSVGVSDDVSLPQFKVLGYRQKAEDIYLLTGNYSRLACEIQFVRSMGFYVLQVYIPSSLIVAMSWVSFWINRNASPARVMLGITTVLTMTTLMSTVNKELPKISYVKSTDVFLGTCFVMVFAALLEYAACSYLAKRIQMRKTNYEPIQKMADELKKLQEERKKREEEQDDALRMFHLRNTQVADFLDDEGGAGPHWRSSTFHDKIQPFPQTPQHQRLPPPYFLDMGPSSSQPSTYNRRHGHPYAYPYSYTAPATPRAHRPHPTYIEEQERKKAEEERALEKTLEMIRTQTDSNRVCGISPSDIDKYSRVLFPACFFCFQLLYWIVYVHISTVDVTNLVLLKTEQ